MDDGETKYTRANTVPTAEETKATRTLLFRIRGAILAEIDTNEKIEAVEYWQDRLNDLEEVLAILEKSNHT